RPSVPEHLAAHRWRRDLRFTRSSSVCQSRGALMRVVLADLKSDRGFVSKDTVVGGYGSRLDPFTRVTAVIAYYKKQFGEVPSGIVVSEQIDDLDSLPFPRWDLVTEDRGRKLGIKWSSRPVGGGYPLLASRGCPEFCTYCPHRILAGYRMRSIANIVDEMERLCDQVSRPYVIFRDPLFTEQPHAHVQLLELIHDD